MKFLETVIPMDFSAAGLSEALAKMRNETGREEVRLIISNTYLHHQVCESIFYVRGKMDIPFEVSYALPRDAWMLVEDENKVIFYSPGV